MNHEEALELICVQALRSGTARDVGDAIELLRADAQALADVRTLDATATTTSYWRTKPQDGRDFECARMFWSAEANAWLSGPSFEGETPEAARAKAAEWVREQKP